MNFRLPVLRQLSLHQARFPTPLGNVKQGLRTLRITQGITKCNGELISAAQEEAATRRHRFYVETLPDAIGATSQLPEDESRHATKALRLGEGDEVQLCDGRGGLLHARITAAGRKQVTVEALAPPTQEAWKGPRWEVAAGFGLLKGGRADWLVEKCVELGAYSLIPLVSKRVHAAGAGWKVNSKPSKSKEDSPHGRAARFERIAVAATKQSLRAHGLQLGGFAALETYLEEGMRSHSMAFVAVAGAPEMLHDEVTRHKLSLLRNDKVALIIGPEGDFTPAEVDAIIAAGAIPVGLGPNRLRVETAAVALLAASTCFQRACTPGSNLCDL